MAQQSRRRLRHYEDALLRRQAERLVDEMIEEVVAFMLLLFPAGVDTTWLSLG